MLYCGYKIKQETKQNYVETPSTVYLNNQLYKLVETPKEQFWLRSDDNNFHNALDLVSPTTY